MNKDEQAGWTGVIIGLAVLVPTIIWMVLNMGCASLGTDYPYHGPPIGPDGAILRPTYEVPVRADGRTNSVRSVPPGGKGKAQ